MNYGCDKYIMDELLRARGHWMEKAEDVYSDVWLTAKNLTELYPCFTKDWLSRYGCYLERARVEIWDENDNCQCTNWGYSLNFVKKKIEQGYISCHDKRYYFNEDNTGFRMTHEYYW